MSGSLALIISLAVLAMAAAVALAMIQARRLTRPLQELASAADRLGSGDASPLGQRYGVPELDRVAEGLDGSAQRIGELLAAEREFAADASHQLRTPLTALSMRLEEMLAAADQPEVVREEGAAALLQTERLADVVNQLLGRTRRRSSGTPALLSIDDVVAQQVVEWDPAFRRKNRKLEVSGEKNLTAHVTPGMLSQVIATLLDNALVHGAGTVAIRTSLTPKSVVIEVRDEGRGVHARAGAPDLRAQREQQAGRHRAWPGAGPQHRRGRGRPGGAGPAPPRRVRGVPAAGAAVTRGRPAGGQRPGLIRRARRARPVPVRGGRFPRSRARSGTRRR